MSLPLIAGNWKMNTLAHDAAELAGRVSAFVSQHEMKAEVVLCPPALWIQQLVKDYQVEGVKFGAQNCHQEKSGAFTGEISAAMIEAAGAEYVIIGHSERRQYFAEDHDLIRQKIESALAAGLKVIYCIGETREQREQGQTEAALEQQLKSELPDIFHAQRLIVAYEPVWAIGTGLTPDLNQIAQAHRFIHDYLGRAGEKETFRVLYGGSVKPANAGPIFDLHEVNGFLIGGASLNGDDFCAILQQVNHSHRLKRD